jgi:hypothetical protein
MRNQKDFAALHLQEIQQLDDFNYSWKIFENR